jgi:hypothetical protein
MLFSVRPLCALGLCGEFFFHIYSTQIDPLLFRLSFIQLQHNLRGGGFIRATAHRFV